MVIMAVLSPDKESILLGRQVRRFLSLPFLLLFPTPFSPFPLRFPTAYPTNPPPLRSAPGLRGSTRASLASSSRANPSKRPCGARCTKRRALWSARLGTTRASRGRTRAV